MAMEATLSENTVRRIKDYTVLPIDIPVPRTLKFNSGNPPSSIKHYSYIRAHAPILPDPEQERSLFMANIPIDTTEEHLRHIFTDQLGGGRIESVEFEGSHQTRKSTSHASSTALATLSENMLSKRGKKRKRPSGAHGDGSDALPSLDEVLPQVWNRQLHASGSSAIIRFIDRPSMLLALKAARKSYSSPSPTPISWQSDSSSLMGGKLGSSRYMTHNKMRFPSSAELQEVVDGYMVRLSQKEEAEIRAAARKRAVPDEDGFVTVTRRAGGRGGKALPARQKETEAVLEAQTKRDEAKRLERSDFYRFQMREKRKENAGKLVQRFQDRKKMIHQQRQRQKQNHVKD